MRIYLWRREMRVENKIWNISKFIKMKDQIEAQPLYQRGSVWKDAKRRLLVDSILRQLDVPKIYLNSSPDNPTYQYQIVDGQQRLSSIWQFAGNNITLDLPNELNKSPWYNKSYQSLAASEKKRFVEFPIAVGLINDATDDEVRDLFARLQMGDKLTPAELRNSIQSAIGTEVRQIALNHKFFSNCRISPARYKHHDFAAHAFAIEIYKGKNDLKAMNLRDMYIKYKNNASSQVSRRVARTLNYLNSVQNAFPRVIITKWGFVDLFLIATKAHPNLPSPDDFGKRYKDFETKRRKNNARPEELLLGSQKDKDMFSYIEAFKLSGGISGNIQKRNTILTKVILKSKK